MRAVSKPIRGIIGSGCRSRSPDSADSVARTDRTDFGIERAFFGARAEVSVDVAADDAGAFWTRDGMRGDDCAGDDDEQRAREWISVSDLRDHVLGDDLE